MRVTIRYRGEERILDIGEGMTVADAIGHAGIPLKKPCGGGGRCGKCKVQAVGALTPPDAEELSHLSAQELQQGIRLACLARIAGEVTVLCPDDRQTTVLTDIEGDLPVGTPLSGAQEGCAMAVDIGTTTVAAYLYEMPSGRLIERRGVENPQSVFGADVISRIEAAGQGHLGELSGLIRRQVSDLAGSRELLCRVICGNTTMLHLFCGLDPSGIAVAPFTPLSLFGNRDGDTYFPRCISAYVGADITCAVMASGMLDTDRSFLVDIGTNGEMAWYRDGELVCASTAAGPCFEGAGISCGMPAAPGAINRVRIDGGTVRYTVIGDAPARGICGSGLIDAIACMLDLGVIDETGYLEENFQIGDSGICITPADVRQVQLAKAAIRAGIATLCPDPEQIDRFCIAGGFGSYADRDSCIRIGMIPPEVRDRIEVIGNAAGKGAAMMLLSADLVRRSDAVARAARTAELSCSPVFAEQYMNHMFFPA